MPLVGRRSEFSAPTTAFERQLVPVGSVLLASAIGPLFPFIATMPLFPPLGLLLLLGWRLLRPEIWPAWAALGLGLFDDLFSGQPLGSAMALWTMTLLVLDVVDTRLLWRDHTQDWGLAAMAIAGVVSGGWLFAEITGGATPFWLMLPQIAITICLFPQTSRLCARLDRWRFAS
jgi:rod shape-determining protein MreD